MRHEGVHLAYAMLSRMQAVGIPPDVTPGCMKVAGWSFHSLAHKHLAVERRPHFATSKLAIRGAGM